MTASSPPPRIGDLVLFRLDRGPNTGDLRPALVVRVWGAAAAAVNLVVFTDHINDDYGGPLCWLAARTEGPEPGQWRRLESAGSPPNTGSAPGTAPAAAIPAWPPEATQAPAGGLTHLLEQPSEVSDSVATHAAIGAAPAPLRPAQPVERVAEAPLTADVSPNGVAPAEIPAGSLSRLETVPVQAPQEQTPAATSLQPPPATEASREQVAGARPLQPPRALEPSPAETAAFKAPPLELPTGEPVPSASPVTREPQGSFAAIQPPAATSPDNVMPASPKNGVPAERPAEAAPIMTQPSAVGPSGLPHRPEPGDPDWKGTP